MKKDASLPTLKANFQHFLDANTLCYSNLDLYECSGDLFQLKYRFDIIESKLWICQKCFSDMKSKTFTNIGEIL